MPAKTLTEQALEPGVHWVHPETHLEYEDYHAWFAGNDPIPHWINARIKEVHQGRHDQAIFFLQDGNNCTFAEYLAERAAFFRRCYDRYGRLNTARFADLLAAAA